MKITLTPLHLTKRYALTISRGTAAGSDNVLVTVEDEGFTGYGEFAPVGEASPPETMASAMRQLASVEPLLADVAPWEFQRIEGITDDAGVQRAAYCALDMALHDWMGKRLGVPTFQLFGADVTRIVPSSITVGINPPDVVRDRVAEIVARLSPKSIKVKLGSPIGTEHDETILAAVQETAPAEIAIRVDANGGWPDVATASRMMGYLADRGVEYIEQPLAEGQEDDLPALFRDRRLPIYADESCRVASDVPLLAGRVDGVNLKLMKAGGIRESLRIIQVARAHSLGVMMGCMSESPLAISGSVCISAFADHLDLDSHLNIVNPDFDGLLWQDGRVLPGPGNGLGVSRRSGDESCIN